jgi:hypothetical protein
VLTYFTAIAAGASVALFLELHWPRPESSTGGGSHAMFERDFADSLRTAAAPGFSLAVAAHLSVALLVAEKRTWAALALGFLAFAAVRRLLSVRGLPIEPKVFRRTASAFLGSTVLLALAAFLPPGAGDGWFLPLTASASRSDVAGPKAGGGTSPTAKSGEGGEHEGVIIWPEIEPHAILVPPLPALRSNPFEKSQAEPLAIPFFGVYWLYKFPDRRPPPQAFETRGRPDRLTFRSTDWRPLMLEARQNLGRTFELLCCSRIEIDIANADPVANSVMIDLALLDSTRKHLPPVALGRARVRSVGSEGQPAVSETLAFSMPASPARFDEFQVRFHLADRRKSVSPRIAIERFRLVPRR